MGNEGVETGSQAGETRKGMRSDDYGVLIMRADEVQVVVDGARGMR